MCNLSSIFSVQSSFCLVFGCYGTEKSSDFSKVTASWQMEFKVKTSANLSMSSWHGQYPWSLSYSLVFFRQFSLCQTKQSLYLISYYYFCFSYNAFKLHMQNNHYLINKKGNNSNQNSSVCLLPINKLLPILNKVTFLKII